jgi:quercetin dioxygenase-like cupin family protein
MVSAFDDIGAIAPLQIWQGVIGRVVEGERITMAVIELDPDAIVPEHRHENEQLGIVLSGSLVFRVGEESRQLGAGETWCIPAEVPHAVEGGAEGAVVIDVFSPVRSDWSALERLGRRDPRWP